jgi:protein gp37
MAARFSGYTTRAVSGEDLTQVSVPDKFHGFAERTKAGPHWTGRVELIPEKLTEPLHWRKPRRVFVNSMSDLFHEALPDEAIDEVFAVMALCPQHTFQVLTKRAKRMREWFAAKTENNPPDRPRRYDFRGAVVSAFAKMQLVKLGFIPDKEWIPEANDWVDRFPWLDLSGPCMLWPLPNVHLGVSVESQKYADERIPELLATPAAVRWVSAEPLLEAVDFTKLPCRGNPDLPMSALWRPSVFAPKLDWVVIGGESGPGARPFNLAWARSIIAQCRAAGVACFVKQIGSRPIGWWENELGPYVNRASFKSSKGGDPGEWPEDLRVREYPA